MSPILAPRISSQFYKRRFSSSRSFPIFSHFFLQSSGDVQFKLNSMTLQAKKDATWHSVCDDGYSTDFASDICQIAGYGLVFREYYRSPIDNLVDHQNIPRSHQKYQIQKVSIFLFGYIAYVEIFNIIL